MAAYASIDDDRSRRRRTAGGVALVGLGAAAALVGSRGFALRRGASQTRLSVRSMTISNGYERDQGRAIGDGQYPFAYLADVAQSTRLAMDDGIACSWAVDGIAIDGGAAATSVEVNLTAVGDHFVTADCADAAGVGYNYTVTARAVRRELRELSDDEREAYFGALFSMYALTDAEGKVLYGDEFVSAAWLVRQHLYGAAAKDCDHWHDDAGIMNHHVGITWELENALRAVDPAVAAHYWDYTYDAKVYGSGWRESPVFSASWFGAITTPGNAEHVVDEGRWAFTPVMNGRALGYSNQTNPYGLLRSPWNVNKVPFVLRAQKVMDSEGDGSSTLPDCAEFETYLTSEAWLGTLLSALNGELHGPVHLMIGGFWGDANSTWASLSAANGNDDFFLLAAKFMWRQGLVRCPETCSIDTAVSDCRCDCPAEIVDGADSERFLTESGVLGLWDQEDPTYALDNFNLTYDDLKAELCSVGLPGEMFTSAAPQDPIFWPLHGNAERFLQYVRLLATAGTISLNETWGYAHVSQVASDTGMVCDWSGVEGMERPKCTAATCAGHREDDLLEFDSLFASQTSLYTNREFYELTAPESTVLPYVYNSLSHWPGCYDSALNVTASITDDAYVAPPPGRHGTARPP